MNRSLPTTTTKTSIVTYHEALPPVGGAGLREVLHETLDAALVDVRQVELPRFELVSTCLVVAVICEQTAFR